MSILKLIPYSELRKTDFLSDNYLITKRNQLSNDEMVLFPKM